MDQASGLRQMVRKKVRDMRDGIKLSKFGAGPSFPRVISVTSGKGGVGKTNIVGNLAIAFKMLGKRVLILDGDLGLANIDIIFGLNPAYNIKHVISGEKDLADVIVNGPRGIRIIPAGSGLHELVHLSQGEKLNLLNEFDRLDEAFDIFLIDTGAGISSNIMYFNMASEERIVVVTSEPTSITDAYALMKVLFKKYGTNTFKLLVNMVESTRDAKSVFLNLSNAVEHFLSDISLEYLGFVPKDENVARAVKQQRAVIECYPESASSKEFHELACRLLASSKDMASDGNIKFFWRKLIIRQ